MLGGGGRLHGLIVASYRRRLGVVAVREMARHRYRQSQMVGLTRAQLSGIAREAQRHRDGMARGEERAERAERAVEMAQERVAAGV